MTEVVSNRVWTVPNILSATRLLMAFVVFALIPLHFYLLAFVLFVIAASTDWIDGWYARRFQQVTQLGRILDPFCDKIIICGSFVLIAVEMDEFPWHFRIAGWIAVVVLGREMLVTALRSFIEQSGGDFSAKMAGKLKMLFQCIAAGGSLLALHIHKQSDLSPSESIPSWIQYCLIGSIWATVVFTVYSGVEYILAAAKFIRNASRANK